MSKILLPRRPKVGDRVLDWGSLEYCHITAVDPLDSELTYELLRDIDAVRYWVPYSEIIR